MKAGKAWLLLGAAAVAGVCAVVGCSSGGGSGGTGNGSETVGSVEVALSAIGPDGATYSLPQGTGLVIAPVPTGTTTIVGLNATTATQSFTIPPGNYALTLQGGTDAGAFTLNRTANSGPSTVVALLTDKQPRSVTVATNQTTSVPFHFIVPQIGNVTLSTGTLATSLQVDGGTADAGHAVFNGNVPFQTTSPGNNPAVNALFTPWDSPTIQISMSMALATPFTAAIDVACATGPVTLTAFALGGSATDQNVAAFVSEANGGNAYLCFNDTQSGGGLSMRVQRQGAPQSAPLQAALGAGTMFFDFNLYAQAPNAYDGTTVSLSQFTQPVTLQMTLYADILANGTLPVTFGNTQPFPVTMTLTP
jgi:hypothetical protein